MKKYKLLIFCYICVFLFQNTILATTTFLYDTDTTNSYITKESSAISTIATPPTFNFESASQILMEPSTGKILYANNENEKLLPASVTKVMTY